VRPVETLHALSGKTAPGRAPEFTPAHVAIALLVIKERSPGRKQLSADLRLGEGTVRNLLRRLNEEGMVSSTRQGVELTSKGESLLVGLGKFIRGTPVPRSHLTVGEHNHAVLVAGGAQKVRLGVEQRDHALISGASGATTLIYMDGGFEVPALQDVVEESVAESIMGLRPRDGDAVIIGTADDAFSAMLGAYAAGLELLT
jgi:predicted transcriptional regulator